MKNLRVLHWLTKSIKRFVCFESKGFTLIEILVIFSLIAVLSGVGAVALSTYSQSQQLSQSASNIKLLIQEARFNAISSVNISTDTQGQEVTCGSRKLTAYMVRTNINLNTVELYMVCESTLSNLVLVKTYTPPSPITISSSTSCSDIYFNALTAMSNGAPCSIDVGGFNVEKSVMIDTGGNVFVN